MGNNNALNINKRYWDTNADYWFGATLDFGCGSGHSLLYMGKRSAAELWGLDISSKQINNANNFLNTSGYSPKLFVSPMEENPGIPLNHFDVVYSIYALGWTVDLERTISMVSMYLKQGGIFIFSWDNPLMECLEANNVPSQLEIIIIHKCTF